LLLFLNSFDLLQTTERDLEEAFSKYGPITKTRVISDRDTGKPRGFGFVSFENVRDAEEALNGMHGFNLQGREIRVDRTEVRSKRDPREKPLCRLYLKGDCKYGSNCRFSHEDSNGGGGGSRYGDRDRDWGRGGDRDWGRDRDSRRGGRDAYDRRDSRRDDSRDRRDTRRDDSRERSRRDDREPRKDSSRERREPRKDERRDSRRDRDFDDRY
jgi:RNA recognition motif-containing protein